MWKLPNQNLDLSSPIIMGILNVTPDSFSDGGEYLDLDVAVDYALEMEREGAEIIDIGGESSRPGAISISVSEEISRVIPVIRKLRKRSDCVISVDTYKEEVAEKALEEGADIINNIKGFHSSDRMLSVCASYSAGMVVMHMLGTPISMQESPHYDCVISDIASFFEERFYSLVKKGINPESICFDPGIGFGKTIEHNLEILANLPVLSIQNRSLVIGVSRKSFISRILHSNEVDYDFNTVLLTVFCQQRGVKIHRVHNVRKNREALEMAMAIETEKIG